MGYAESLFYIPLNEWVVYWIPCPSVCLSEFWPQINFNLDMLLYIDGTYVVRDFEYDRNQLSVWVGYTYYNMCIFILMKPIYWYSTFKFINKVFWNILVLHQDLICTMGIPTTTKPNFTHFDTRVMVTVTENRFSKAGNL